MIIGRCYLSGVKPIKGRRDILLSSIYLSWYPAKEVSATSLPHIIQPKRGERNSRRVSVLNKLFMKYISDLLTAGELTPGESLEGLEISKVKISADFSVLSVYWVAKGTVTDDKFEGVLPDYAGRLRHELTQLRLIGNVPVIRFIKDKSLNKVAEVDALLAVSDFGDDFVPTDPSYYLLSNLTLSTKLPQHLEEKILSLNGDYPDMPVPSMQSDALGIDHDGIMQKIQLSMKKAKAPHRIPAAINSENVELNSDEETSLTSLKAEDSVKENGTEIIVQNSELRKFFAKRKALQSKVLKTPKNYEPGKEILLSQENSLDDEEEDFDDYDTLANNAHRIKELEIHEDDFEEIDSDFKSPYFEGRNLK
ncbi:uncharacterized protein [Hetaerina americana]|uniref:uncharacterized protein isoform X2 n=1 Tax=Hetaerina americana TaxID=62018 RepID=UPI003A7F2134